MQKRWGICFLVAALALLGGCKETQDQGKEAMEVLRGTATPGTSKSSGTHMAQTAASAPSQKVQTPPPSPASQKGELLEKMGIEIGNGRLVIDTNRTRSYLEALSAQLRQGVDTGVEKAKRHASGVEDIGIHIQEDRVEIDLNKTKNFLKIWGESMKILGEELERSIEPPQ